MILLIMILFMDVSEISLNLYLIIYAIMLTKSPLRYNPDTGINDYGSRLIKLWKSTCLRIRNGRDDGASNDFTFCGHNGRSVIGYLLMSFSLFPIVKSFIVYNFTDCSDHAPLHLQLFTENVSILNNSTKADEVNRNKKPTDNFKYHRIFKRQLWSA